MAETFAPGASVSVVARRHDLNANMVFTWRRQIGSVPSHATSEAVRFVPATIAPEPVSVEAPVSPVVGRMEIVLANDDRMVVDTGVDATALARVVKVLSRR